MAQKSEKQTALKLVDKLLDGLQNLIVLPEDSVPRGRQVLETIVAAVLTKSIIILHGPPGCAKSTVIKLIGKAFGITGQWRINGTTGTKEEDLVGGLDLVALSQGQRKVQFSPFTDTPIALLDEVDKINPYAMAPLLPLLAEGEARVGTDCKTVPKRFFAMTMNPPAAGQGNFELPDALKDRADAEIHFPQTSFAELMGIYDSVLGNGNDLVNAMPVLGTSEDLAQIQDLVAAIPVSKEAKTAASLYVGATSVCKKNAKTEMRTFPACCAECEMEEATLPCSKVTPMSARAGISALNLAKGMAFLRGGKEVKKDDVDSIFPFVMSHRVSFPGHIVDSRSTFIWAFFGRLQGAVNPALKVLNAPELLSEEELVNLKKSSDPLVAKAVQLAKEELGLLGEKLKRKLPTMGVKQLQEAKTKAGLSMKERQVIDEMILARKTVDLEVHNEAILESPDFQNLFTSPEGEPFFDSLAWEQIIGEGRIDQASLLGYLGVDMAFEDNILMIMLEDATSGDEFRARMLKNQATMGKGFTVLCPYESKGLTPKLQEAGFLPPAGE